MTMANDSAQMPTLTAEERATLLGHEAPLRIAEQTLDKLESIGADVSAERDFLNRTKQMREGLLQHFSTGVIQNVPVRPTRARKS